MSDDNNLKCSHCGEIKAKTEFPISRTIKRGYNYWCKPCLSEHLARIAEDKFTHKTPRVDESVKAKFCPRCGETKPVAEFPLRSRSKTGYYTYCRNCVREINAEYNKKKKGS